MFRPLIKTTSPAATAETGLLWATATDAPTKTIPKLIDIQEECVCLLSILLWYGSPCSIMLP